MEINLKRYSEHFPIIAEQSIPFMTPPVAYDHMRCRKNRLKTNVQHRKSSTPDRSTTHTEQQRESRGDECRMTKADSVELCVEK
jgi:hypothetical protein